ncbi:MAG TPA: BlaI/MecI/CopY family transcriptional regulator [Symbiobacteriaceae bacterium]|jgi:BlaI family transcriptional regulator, penicillinase repressor|nr:BlaI/MecI/CopY family transcriptional regulator [Symbiobacteriaceae bacterium]
MGDAPHGFALGPLESEILRLIWEGGETGVDEVHRTLAASREIAYTTVQTVMTRLAQRGLLERRKAGKAYLYRAAVPREEVAGSTLKEMVQRFFGGQRLSAVSFLLGAERLSGEEVAELRRLVERLEKEEER